jgi:HAD superfamily phosphoserine phosphatase-like hydrolase
MAKRRVAVFDIDGTIFRSSLLIELVEELISLGKFPDSVRRTYSKSQQDWLNRKGSYEKYISDVVLAFDRNIHGVKEEDLLIAVKQVIAAQQHHVYRYTRDMVKKLKRQKYFLLAISHSPRYAVDDFCNKMGFDKIYGRIFELNRSKRFTGRIFYSELIADKAKILKRAVVKEGLTMKGSIGVGDTESDIKFLKLVDKPICFNPNRKLYQAAKRNNWPVVVERKDVVYKIKF